MERIEVTTDFSELQRIIWHYHELYITKVEIYKKYLHFDSYKPPKTESKGHK